MQAMMTPSPSVRYILGMDLGAAECAGAVSELRPGLYGQRHKKPEDIRLCGNSHVLPSAYAIVGGTMYIGHSALRHIHEASSFRISFKHKPTEMTEEDRAAFARFMHHAYQLMVSGSGVLVPGNHQVALSCPSGWTEEDKSLYKDMARDAGIPLLGIWPESRVGFFSNLQNQPEENRLAMQEGCIRCDYGSHSADYCYHNATLPQPVRDSGTQLGAQNLDLALFHYILAQERNAPIRGLLQDPAFDGLKDVLIFVCRMAKEEFFSNGMENPLRCSYALEDIFAADDPRADIRFVCNSRCGGAAEDILKLCRGGLAAFGLHADPDPRFPDADWDAVNQGYFPALARDLQHFTGDTVRDMPVRLLILSGGASAMFLSARGQELFADEILPAAFPDRDIRVAFDTRPSTSVSRGVCSLANACAKAAGIPGVQDSLKETLRQVRDFHLAMIHPERRSSLTFTEPARIYLRTALRTDPDFREVSDRLGLSQLKEAVWADQPLHAVATPAVLEEFQTLLTRGLPSLPAPESRIAQVITDIVLPLEAKTVLGFSGHNLAQLQDAISEQINAHNEEIRQTAFDKSLEIVSRHLQIGQACSLEVIRLYSADLCYDFGLDPGQLEKKIDGPAIDQILKHFGVFEKMEKVLNAIVVSVLGLLHLAWTVVSNIFLVGIPFLLSYFRYQFTKGEAYPSLSWLEWRMRFLDHVDAAKIPLPEPVLQLMKTKFTASLDENRKEMERTLREKIEKTGFKEGLYQCITEASEDCQTHYFNKYNALLS